MAQHAEQDRRMYATGRQYGISRGDARAVIAELAGAIRSFQRGGIDLTETYPDDRIPPAGSGIMLAPWPNRIQDGRWTLDGATQQLDITEVARNNAIHGLLRNAGYQLLDRTDTSVQLAATIFPQHGYPFKVEHRVHYEIDEDLSLTVTQELINSSPARAPFALGAHPCFKIGDVPTKDLTLTVNAETRLLTNDQQIPQGTEPASGGFDLRSGRRVGELDLDTAYTDLDFTDGKVRHTLSADDGRSVSLWASGAFQYTQVFVTDQFPGVEKAVAMEPMTAPANAFNSGEGLRWLEPGESFSASWGISAKLG
ncbi:aldose 1-epimerase family protein [Arthrobacter sp. H14]|uniref:aldose 1-epimerase family protein n=1 Tax=Arthrobacter sp. H14 TaxID=1312959 RepID=UPI0006865B12|nr:aldose 1-epimerase family protein [Arthrobacter sp. H14]